MFRQYPGSATNTFLLGAVFNLSADEFWFIFFSLLKTKANNPQGLRAITA